MVKAETQAIIIGPKTVPTALSGLLPNFALTALGYPGERGKRALKELIERDEKIDVVATKWLHRTVRRRLVEAGFKVIHIDEGPFSLLLKKDSKDFYFSYAIEEEAPYYDSTHPSRLESLLNTYDFEKDLDLIKRANGLRDMIIRNGLSQYVEKPVPDGIEALYGEKMGKEFLFLDTIT